MSQRRNRRTITDAELAELEASDAAEVDARTLAREISTTGALPGAGDVKRSKLGWKIRLDLKKACQQIALDTDMRDYEVLEMLLDEALAARAAGEVEK